MTARALVVHRASGLVTVQDLGRPGFMHLGIAPGGPLAPSRLRAANAALGNYPRAAAIEVMGTLDIVADVAGEGALVVALDGEEPRNLATGETLSVSADRDRRVRYLAVRGGLDVPVVFGGRGTLLVASLGGLEGRVLRRGDHLEVLPAPGYSQPPTAIETSPFASELRVVPGPDLDAFESDAIATLVGSSFTISRDTDRVGTRLDGPPLRVRTDAKRRSTPMVRGAMQVPPDGRLIVLGPDHPTTGGYPLIGVIASDDVEGAVARPIGASVTFRLA